MIESSKKVKPWRQDVVAAVTSYMAANSVAMIDAPVRVELTFVLPKPLSAPKRKITYPSKKPDIDKLCRSTLDALTTAGLIRDDARVIELVARKVYPELALVDMPGCGAIIGVYPIYQS